MLRECRPSVNARQIGAIGIRHKPTDGGVALKERKDVPTWVKAERNKAIDIIQESQEYPRLFFEAWRDGVILAGPIFFGQKTPDTAINKNDLRPDFQMIERALPSMGTGEAQFMSALVSFFDPQKGELLSSRLKTEKSLCGLTIGIDATGKRILARLLTSYCGW